MSFKSSLDMNVSVTFTIYGVREIGLKSVNDLGDDFLGITLMHDFFQVFENLWRIRHRLRILARGVATNRANL